MYFLDEHIYLLLIGTLTYTQLRESLLHLTLVGSLLCLLLNAVCLFSSIWLIACLVRIAVNMAYYPYLLLPLTFLTYFIAKQIIKYHAAWSFSKAHGCKPIYQIPQSERILGYTYFKKQVKAVKDGRMLESKVERYDEHGMTWSSISMGRVVINTIDPENVKAVLATNFKDFGHGPRLDHFGPLLGAGVFTTDGAHWEHSRVCMSACGS